MYLDPFDRAILGIVQSNNRLANREIAQQVNLSETAVRRRLERLRKTGVIAADVAILDRNQIAETLIVSVIFRDDQVGHYNAFRQRMLEDAQVSQVYSIAGEVDFILHVHAENLSGYEAWAETQLLSDPAIQRFETSVVFTTVKFDTALALNERDEHQAM
nr:Lrp/AsnC family transcriptional regulator [Maricaulis sp.]